MGASKLFTEEEARMVLERAQALEGQKRYAEARVVAGDALPLLGEVQDATKARLYLLISKVPGGGFSSEKRTDALAVAERLIAGGNGDLPDRIRGYLLYEIVRRCCGTPNDEAAEQRVHRVAGDERREHFALERARELLGRGDARRQDCTDAHVLICCQSLDSKEIEPHMEAVLESGDDPSIVMAAIAVMTAFHRDTRLRLLDRALGMIGDPVFRAILLEKKMRALFSIMADGPKEDEESEALDSFIHEEMLAAYTELQWLPGAELQRARSHLFVSVLIANDFEENMAWYHFRVAEAMAERLDSEELRQEVAGTLEYLEWKFENETDDDEEGDDDDEEEEQDDDWWRGEESGGSGETTDEDDKEGA
jgi:hypothetical protein